MILWKNCTMSVHTLTMKATILRKMQVTVKTFAQLIFSHFSLSLKRKKSNGNHEKETKHSHASRASAADLPDIRIGNVNWCKCRCCKKEVREIDYLCCREVDAISDEKFKGIAKPFVFTWIVKKIMNTLSLSFEGKWCEITLLRSSHRRCSVKKGVLRNSTKFTEMPEACNFIKKESLTQVISCEFCKISQNTFFTEHLRVTASVFYNFKWTYRGSDITKKDI